MAEPIADADAKIAWDEYSKELAEFLARRLGVDPADLPSSTGWAGSGNAIGALALRLGVLTLDQVEQVVDQQAGDARMFGELATALGFCTEDDIERLIEVQRLHRCVDQAALLVVDGRVDSAQLLAHLTAFAEGGGLD